MRKDYSAEILLLISASFCGMIMNSGYYWSIWIGGFFLFAVSYFITPLLKRATIEGYIKATQNHDSGNTGHLRGITGHSQTTGGKS